MLKDIKVLVFDAYGTIFDVHSLSVLAEKLFPGNGATLSQLWRAKQLEYMFIRSLIGNYVPHKINTEKALSYCLENLRLEAKDSERDALMTAYERLSPFPESKTTLALLKRFKRSILSVGTPELLRKLVNNAGIEDCFDSLLSVDSVKIYKPHPRTYQLVLNEFNVQRHEVCFVTSNYFDVAGAASFGFNVVWVNRLGATPDKLDLMPTLEIRSLSELPGVLV